MWTLTAMPAFNATDGGNPAAAAADEDTEKAAEEEAHAQLEALEDVLPGVMAQVHSAMASWHSRQWSSLYDKPDALHPVSTRVKEYMRMLLNIFKFQTEPMYRTNYTGGVLRETADAFGAELNRCRPSEGPCRMRQSISTPLILRLMRGVSLRSLSLSPPLWARSAQYDTGGSIGTSGEVGAGEGEVRGMMPLADSHIKLRQLQQLLWQRLVLTHTHTHTHTHTPAHAPAHAHAARALAGTSSSASGAVVASAGTLRFHWTLLEHSLRCFGGTLPRANEEAAATELSECLHRMRAALFEDAPAGVDSWDRQVSVLLALLQRTHDLRLRQVLGGGGSGRNTPAEADADTNADDSAEAWAGARAELRPAVLLERGQLLRACFVSVEQAVASAQTVAVATAQQPLDETQSESESGAAAGGDARQCVCHAGYAGVFTAALGLLRLRLLLPSSPLDPALKPALKRAVLRGCLRQLRGEARLRSWAEALTGGSVSAPAVRLRQMASDAEAEAKAEAEAEAKDADSERASAGGRSSSGRSSSSSSSSTRSLRRMRGVRLGRRLKARMLSLRVKVPAAAAPDAPNGCVEGLQRRIHSTEHRSQRLRAKLIVRAGVGDSSGSDAHALQRTRARAKSSRLYRQRQRKQRQLQREREQERVFSQLYEAVWRFVDSSVLGGGGGADEDEEEDDEEDDEEETTTGAAGSGRGRAVQMVAALTRARLRCDELIEAASAAEAEAEAAMSAVEAAAAATEHAR
eukprot:g2420.t1